MTGRTAEQDALRKSESAIRLELANLGAVLRGKACKCPFHEDQHPSAGIFEGDGGSWHFKCQVCGAKGDIFDLRARARKVDVSVVLAEYRPSNALRSPGKTAPALRSLEAVKASYASVLEATYVYTNPTTKAPDMAVLRIRKPEGGKRFLQYRPVAGGWEAKAPVAPRPLYNRIRMAGAAQVIVVEGEKCVHALADVGFVATTSPIGAGNAKHADWTPLAGKTCILWPDNDPPNAADKPRPGKRTGLEHMREVAAILATITPAPRVLWLDPDDLGLPEKGDVVDYLAEYGGSTLEERRRAIETALSIVSPIGRADELETLIEDSISGRRRSIPFPWPVLTRLSRALMPGMVTIVAGDPGSGKSFLMLEAAAWWHRNGVKVALFELEDDRAYHLNRVLAQLSDNGDLIDSEWIRKHPDAARAAMTTHREFIEGFASCITTTTEDVSLADLLKWIETKASTGAEIIIIDPITAARVSPDRSWQDERDFMLKAKGIVKSYGSRLVLVSHPKLGTKRGDKNAPLHGLAGGAAYPRFAHNVFWITNPERPRKVFVYSDHGTFRTTANRTLRIGKARNGPGTGVELAYIFEGSNLRFSEQGAIAREDDQEQINEAAEGSIP